MSKCKGHGLLIFTLICVIMLAGGIFLATRTRIERRSPAPGETWKLVLGTMIASFGGFGFIGGILMRTYMKRVILLVLCSLLIGVPVSFASWTVYNDTELSRLHDMVGQYGIQSVAEIQGAVEMGVSDDSSDNHQMIRNAIKAMDIDPDGILFHYEKPNEKNDWYKDYYGDQASGNTYYHNAHDLMETCYHATPLCINAGEANDAISLEDAQAKDLLPCPVCVQETSDSKGVRAVTRGGTYVLKMTDEWMNTRPDIGSVFAAFFPGIYTGEEMYAPLAERLHGDAYVSFLEAIQSGGTASAPAHYPGIYPQNDELEMCQRHIGGAWYTVLRPNESARRSMAKKGILRIYLRFFGGESSYKDGTLTLGEGDEWGDDEYLLQFEKIGSDVEFSKEYDGLALTLFDELDSCIFVLREHNADADLLVDVGLSLDGEDTGLCLTGYMDGTDAVYVGVFTAPETAAIRNGATLALSREPWLTEAAYQGTDYAIVKKGTAGYGVVDRTGNFVIPTIGDEYGQSIYRMDDTFFVVSNREPRSLRVVHMESFTAVELANIVAPAGGHTTYYGCNHAVFIVQVSSSNGASWQIRDMDTGVLLEDMVIDESNPDSPTYGAFMGMNPCYVLEAAKPERLVFGAPTGEGERMEYWLADNRGKRISDNWQYIEPLSWDYTGGMFLVSTWDENEHGDWPNDQEDVLSGYDGRPWFGSHWRCGIIDHNGNLLAPCMYTKVTLLSTTEVKLETPDGQIVVVGL